MALEYETEIRDNSTREMRAPKLGKTDITHPQSTFIQTSFQPDSFIAKKRSVVRDNTIDYQLDLLKSTGRYDAFKLKWHDSYKDEPNHWPIPNHLFWDSDVAKWVEGACYFLLETKSKRIENAVNELVEMIRSAQQPDGYLNIHFTVVHPEGRFTNLRDMHELYNAGHLIEAAVAHHQLYDNDKLLGPIVKYVDLLAKTFGPGDEQRHGYPGHPEIELALLRLYCITKDQNHFDLAKFFLEERGNATGQDGKHYYDVEAVERGERPYERPRYFPERRSYWYQQAHKPILEQQSVEGHSVRAMYLLTAVADLVYQSKAGGVDRSDFADALHTMWSNMVEKKMYLTGAVGAIDQWEGFGIDYFLPQSTDEGGCYAETCAAIGVMMLAERLLQIEPKGHYGDIMELAFYNAVLSGMSANGKQFAYTNQLASSDAELSKREQWFTCACCPPNVTRLLGYIGGYLWTVKLSAEHPAADVFIHLFSSATMTFEVGEHEVQLKQTSNWPWEGNIEFELTQPDEGVAVTIAIRIPAWAESWTLSPSPSKLTLEDGYLYLTAAFAKLNRRFILSIPLKPRVITSHPYTNQDVVALARGPLVYCVEDVDNQWVTDHFKNLLFDPSAEISSAWKTNDALGESYYRLTAIDACSFLDVGLAQGPGFSVSDIKEITKAEAKELHFIPYFLRANRAGKGQLRVGLRRRR